MREHGRVTRGRIGVQLQELSYDMATSLGLKEPKGALVAAVQAGGPAHRAGVRPADIVVGVDGKPVDTTADLARMVGSARPGAVIAAEIWRDAARRQVRIEVEPHRQAP